MEQQPSKYTKTMADSSQSNSNRNQNSNRGDQSGRRNSGGSRGGGNRNRNRSRNRSQSGGDNRGGGSKRFIKQKVPRRTKPPTLWEKFLNTIGLGGKAKAAPKKSESATSPPQPVAARSGQDRPPRKRTARKTAEKKSTRTGSSGGEREPARKPEKVEVTTPRLYVGNLSYDATGEHLESLFAEFGQVEKAEVVSHQRSQRSKGFAFVEMSSVDEAKGAVDSLHDKEFMGRNLVVSGAKSTGVDSGA